MKIASAPAWSSRSGSAQCRRDVPFCDTAAKALFSTYKCWIYPIILLNQENVRHTISRITNYNSVGAKRVQLGLTRARNELYIQNKTNPLETKTQIKSIILCFCFPIQYINFKRYNNYNKLQPGLPHLCHHWGPLPNLGDDSAGDLIALEIPTVTVKGIPIFPTPKTLTEIAIWYPEMVP